jgi:hypothetical protein
MSERRPPAGIDPARGRLLAPTELEKPGQKKPVTGESRGVGWVIHRSGFGEDG